MYDVIIFTDGACSGNPGVGGYGAILTFSTVGDSGIDKAFLCSNATVNFQRNIQKQFFINVEGVAYVLGRGTGMLQLSGMLSGILSGMLSGMFSCSS